MLLFKKKFLQIIWATINITKLSKEIFEDYGNVYNKDKTPNVQSVWDFIPSPTFEDIAKLGIKLFGR